MLLYDYLNSGQQNRRILVVSDLSRGQNLIRKYEALTGGLVRNVTCMTISQLINSVNLYIQAGSGYSIQKTRIDETDAMMLFRSVIFRSIGSLKYFNNKKMMDLVTTGEIFKKANLIRSNGWTGTEPQRDNNRVSDLKLLISEYEQKLEDEKLLDHIALLRSVTTDIKRWPDHQSELRNVFAAEISCLKEDMDELGGLQMEFLSLVQNAQDPIVKLYETEPSADTLSNCRGKARFFRGYGSFNEASYIANDILAKRIPLGSVTVLYSSNTQLPAIRAALKGNGLGMNVISAHPAQDNAYISLARRIIAWASDDFSEKALEKILSSPVIFVETKDDKDEKKNAVASGFYFNHVLDAAGRRGDSFILGWGYKRNLDFIDHELQFAQEDEAKAVLRMHGELIGIFGDSGKPYDDMNKVRPYEVYKKLVSFLESHTVSGADYAVGMDGIRRISGAVGLEDRSLPLREVLSFVDELLTSISQKDPAQADAILVERISDWVLLDRPNVYAIGLALKDMQGSMHESPVLSDQEMDSYIGDGYKPTIRAKVELKEKNLYRTLSSFSGESIVFGFSSYDTIGFYESNPSSFFREVQKSLGGTETKDLPEFVYGNPESGALFDPPEDVPDKESYGPRLETSNSSMEVLLDCPRKYYYSRKMYIPDNQYTESDYSRWLDARLRGSFFHEIAEKYVTQMLVKPASESYEPTADEALIASIAEEIKAKLLIEMPVAFEGLADRETKDLIEVSTSYLSRLHETLILTDWRALAAEQVFKSATYRVDDYNANSYEFVFSGTIDRIDYYADLGEKVIYLRIIDYKTGKKSSKERDDKLGKLLQYSVYEAALMETGHFVDEDGADTMLLDVIKAKIAELESIESMDDWRVEFDSFNYVFPMENTDFDPIRIEAGDIEGINITRLKSILTAMEDKKTFPDRIELYNAVKEYVEKHGASDADLEVLSSNMDQKDKAGNVTGISPNETDHCRYCEYGDLCESRKAGDL